VVRSLKPDPEDSLSAAEARALAITAQGLAAARPASVTGADVLGMIEQLGVLQLDSVNIVQRSHYLPAWSRLGAYEIGALDRFSHEAPRRLFEYWGHEASLLPIAMQPLLRWRMARAAEHAWKMVREVRRKRSLLDRVLGAVRDGGPLRAGDIEGGRASSGGWWGWSETKTAIEWLFYSGHVTAARRKGFERLYDLPERVLPADVLALPTPTERDAIKALLDRAGRSLGVATADDLRDYFRIKPALARPALEELVEAGVLLPTHIEGWTKQAYRHRDVTALPIDPTRAAMLSMFDSLVWCRARTERLFAMRYRIELYTPVEKRVYGYYVLPFLLGDVLAARVDLKADRETKTLRVLAVHGEPKAPRNTAAALATELTAMAAWLGLERVEVTRKGDLAAKLASAMPGRRKQPRRR
jgi:uncharacterized protein YcaQ